MYIKEYKYKKLYKKHIYDLQKKNCVQVKGT